MGQAAAYFNENGIPPTQYPSLLKDQEENVVELLNEDFEDNKRYRETRNSVFTT